MPKTEQEIETIRHRLESIQDCIIFIIDDAERHILELPWDRFADLTNVEPARIRGLFQISYPVMLRESGFNPPINLLP